MIYNLSFSNAYVSRRGFVALSWIIGLILGIVWFLIISNGCDLEYHWSGFSNPSLFGSLMSAVAPVILTSFFVMRDKHLLMFVTIFLKALCYGFSQIAVWQIAKGMFSSSFFAFFLLQSCSCIFMLFSCFCLQSIRTVFRSMFVGSVIIAIICVSMIYHFSILI